MIKEPNKTLKASVLTKAALMTAITFVMTRFLMISPIGTGYIHLGDAAVILSAVLLPHPLAAFSAAVGASLSDLSAGYYIYIPITAVTKIAMTMFFTSKSQKLLCLHNVLAMIPALAVNALGYYIGESIFITKNFAAPLWNIPFNCLQVAVGALIFVIFAVFLDANPRACKIIRGR